MHIDNTVRRINVSLDEEHNELLDKLLIHFYQKEKQPPQIAVLVRRALRELAKANNVQ